MTNRTIAELVSYLQSLDVQLSIRHDHAEVRLRCNAPEGTLTKELRQELAGRKAEIITYLQSTQSAQLKTQVFPLSFAQERLWFLYQLAPNNPFYNVPAAIRLKGTVNRAALERSFNEIVRRHAALRTRFAVVDGQPVQVIEPDIKVDLSVVQLSNVTAPEQISQQLATTEAQRSFNLATDSLLRITLLEFSSTEAMLLLTLHHIVADGWSLGVLVQELAHCYTAFVEERSPELPPLPMQYADFACWQRNWLQGEILEKQRSYWLKQLQDLPVLNLPSDRPRPTVQTYRGATYPLQFSLELTEQLEALSQQTGATLFMILLAAFQTLLHRYTAQEDIAIGVPIANRHRSEVEGLIGFFVNSLVMRSDLSGNPTFRELLEQVRKVALEAYEHQDLPFEKLVEELDPERDLSRNPLFQVAFALQNAPMQSLELPGLTLEPAPLESASTRFDLEVHLWEPAHGLRSLWRSQAGLSGFISYSTDLFDRDRISRLVGHFQTLLERVVANPDDRLSDLPLLTPVEHQLLAQWNQTESQLQNDQCFHQIFEAQVQREPNAIALVSEQETLTYQQLNQRADRLAQTLRHLGVQADCLVGLCVDRSANLLIGILGILKAGGAYVPLDPNYPHDRLRFMLMDTQVSVLLTQSWLIDVLPESSAKIVCLDQPLPLDEECAIASPPTPDQLAYVIYTSGSTGTPKGVLLSHRGLCNVVEAQQRVFHLSRNSRVLQFSSLSFDASIFEIALALGSGSTLYIPSKSAQLPGIALIRYLQDNAITHALLTPAVLAVLPSADLPALRVLITGGEACSQQVIDRWAVDRLFFNAYGPTETTIWSTVAELHPGDPPLSIGRPIVNTQVYLLDTHLNPVPVGIPGELYIGGVGLSRGYLNRSELTTDRFIHKKDLRLYKTGDRACYRPDGSIEFLGRVDDQIKIRGFRVELGEIEATLQRHPAIQDAAVLASGATSNEMRLVAYFSLDLQQLQQTSLQTQQVEQQVEQWQTLYNQTYQSPASRFNITGWNSSYTGEPISPEQMQEWISDRVQQILALKPKRVLEIGCGTGLLLFQLAPHCQKYVGTDFSKIALEGVQNQLATLPQVELLHRIATDFTGIEVESFDGVILNSIVQYFPSVDYLMQVLEGAIQAVAPGGTLWIGDVRNLSLLTAFHAWMQFCKADAGMERSTLQKLMNRSRFEEPELAIDPMFFYALQDRFPQIRSVQIRLSRGQHHNEMTQFRYNVLLHIKDSLIDEAQLKSPAIQSLNWKINSVNVEKIQEVLIQTQPEILIIQNVKNSRVNAAVRTATWLSRGKTPKTVGQMREQFQESPEFAIDPQDWYSLEALLPYTVELTWTTETETGDYDVSLIRQDIDAKTSSRSGRINSWQQYTNNPLQAEFARQLVPQLRQFLKETLPEYMIPAIFLPLEALPITVNGKVDRQALPAFSEDITHSAIAKSSTHPTTATETTLLEIWQNLLRLKQITIHDNFFELGGHSLLATQMTSRVRDGFGLELPLKSVFEAPTIAQLAPVLDTLQQPASKIPPLVRLDRTAFRRQRSTPASNIPDKPSVSWSPLVPLTLGTSKQPFFCIHPMFGVVLPYLELANALDCDRSFYGLQPLGLDGKTPPLNRIEAIAAYYIKAIQTVQPDGAYLLGGWSFGGIVAFEMAQQLTRAGYEVKLLAMLDTPAPCYKPSFYQSLKFLLGTALWSTLPFLLDYSTLALDRLQARNSWFSRWQWSTILRLIPEETRLRFLEESAIPSLLRIVYANAQATYQYVPQAYPHRMVLFKAAEQSDRNSIDRNPTLGWDSLVDHLRVHQVPGNHLSLLKQPHVQTLAQQLNHYLLD
ncbi:amino acid adenylation domain-containing protein [Cyanobacteria bacterium FACHB-DQ100]|nr:amino acid adenylation domain-containing protein [Cyanobacteria bacterium FACHB-DQ100]